MCIYPSASSSQLDRISDFVDGTAIIDAFIHAYTRDTFMMEKLSFRNEISLHYPETTGFILRSPIDDNLVCM